MSELIPVIHMLNEEQVFANVDTCVANGVNQVFIINHAVSTAELMDCAFKVRDRFTVWVGVNRLGSSIDSSIQIDWKLDGIWIDETLTKEHISNCYDGMIFSGLAFKYQPQPTDLKEACELIKKTSNVAVTSGEGTGKPADLEKIQRIREYLGEFPMAIASGVSAQNVNNYKDLANYLLVASSITDHNEMIISDKLKELQDEVC